MVGEKVLCEYCNKEVRKDYVHKHIRTPKHIKNVKDYEDKLNKLEKKRMNPLLIIFLSIYIYIHKLNSIESISNYLYNPNFFISLNASLY